MPTSEKLKVCMVVHNNYYTDARVIQYSKGISDLGCQVDVLCTQGQGKSPAYEHGKVKVYTIPIHHQKEGGTDNLLLEYSTALVFFSFWLFILYVKNRYQVIHVHNVPDILIFTAFIPKIFGAKLILDIHDPMPEFFISKYHKQPNGIMEKFVKIQEYFSAKLADAIITANPLFKANLVSRRIPTEKVTVITNQPDPIIFNRNLYKRERNSKRKFFTLIFPGTIAPRYGLEIAIRALPLLINTIPNLRLIIIGSHTDHVSDLLRLANELHVSSFVEIKPALPIDQIPSQVIQADIGINLSLPDAYMDMVYPGKVVEYAVMGIPIVASRLPGAQELFPETTIMFFEPGNISQFADCVLELYKNPTRREKLVREMDGIIQVHSWQNENDKYISLLNNLLL